MNDLPDNDLVQAVAIELVTRAVRAVDWDALGQIVRDDPRFSGLGYSAANLVRNRLANTLTEAIIAVEWPDSPIRAISAGTIRDFDVRAQQGAVEIGCRNCGYRTTGHAWTLVDLARFAELHVCALSGAVSDDHG